MEIEKGAEMDVRPAIRKALDEAKKDAEFWDLEGRDFELAMKVAENFFMRVSIYTEAIKIEGTP